MDSGMTGLRMNQRAAGLANAMVDQAALLRVRSHTLGNGARVIDAGVESAGGYGAGMAIAEICMGGLGSISYTNVQVGTQSWPWSARAEYLVSSRSTVAGVITCSKALEACRSGPCPTAGQHPASATAMPASARLRPLRPMPIPLAGTPRPAGREANKPGWPTSIDKDDGR
jgi:methenyltetrahydromethanopterin cyclohydrolase